MPEAGERGPRVARAQKRKDGAAHDYTQKRAITILSTGVAYLLASRISGRIIDEPEEHSVWDDVKEALLKASFSLVSTLIASFITRRCVNSRWGG
ncbi:MAG: hypothetical protein JOZ19_09315 [Rubrobacter sp.]|nr:hypothetical protein [Rubrobacter sp.]